MKKSLIILILILLTGCSSPLVGADIKAEWEKADSPLKLKVDKAKILDAVEINDIRCGGIGEECEDLGKIKKYLYISDNKLEKVTIKDNGIDYEEVKRTRNSIILKAKVNEKSLGASGDNFVGIFYSGSPFHEDNNGDWYQTETATTSINAYKAQTKVSLIDKLFNIGVYAASPETYYAGVGDGWIDTYRLTSIWDISHDSTTGNTGRAFYGGDTDLRVMSYQDSTIQRIFVPIDTSGLDNDAVISAADFKIKTTATVYDDDNDGKDFLSVVQTFQTSNTSLVVGDYEDCGSDNGTAARAKYTPVEAVDSGNRLDISNITTGDWLTFSFNATGIGWISKTGYTNLGIREGHDILDEQPTENYTGVRLIDSKNAGTASDPYLYITYTIGGATPAPRQEEVMWFN